MEFLHGLAEGTRGIRKVIVAGMYEAEQPYAGSVEAIDAVEPSRHPCVAPTVVDYP